MEDTQVKLTEVETRAVEDTILVEPKTIVKPTKQVVLEKSAVAEEELEKAERTALDIALTGEDVLLLLDSLKEYSGFLTENKRRANSIIIDESFNSKIDAKIKRADELRFLIKKEVIIVDKAKEIYSIEDDGEVIGIETFEKTEKGTIITEAKPHTVGNTPELPKVEKDPVATSVQTVSEEL